MRTAAIRWLISRDMAEVMKIERSSFVFPWTHEEFLNCLRQRNCIGTVAEVDCQIAGFMIYELHKSALRIVNMGVAHIWRRETIGQQMVQRVVDKLHPERRRKIIVEVRETNLPAQLLFAHNGFKATGILRNHFNDTTEDAYQMCYTLEDKKIIGHNRISNLIKD